VNVTGVFTQETAKNGVPGPSAVKSPTKQSMHEPDTAKEVSVDRQKEKRIVPDNLPTSEPIPSTLSAVDRVSYYVNISLVFFMKKCNKPFSI